MTAYCCEVVRLAKENIAQAKEIARLHREKANNKDVYTMHQARAFFGVLRNTLL